MYLFVKCLEFKKNAWKTKHVVTFSYTAAATTGKFLFVLQGKGRCRPQPS